MTLFANYVRNTEVETPKHHAKIVPTPRQYGRDLSDGSSYTTCQEKI